MQKLNVLFISSWYPSREHPTLGNFIQKHAESVNPFVHLEVLYITSSQQNKEKFEVSSSVINGVNTTVVYYKKITNKIPFLSSVLKYLRAKKGFKKGYEFIKEQKSIAKFDITHCNITYPAGYFALQLKKKEGIPYVISENWTVFLPYRDEYHSFNFMTKRLINSIVKNANLMLPVSHHLANSMAKLGLKQDYKVVPNVVETSLFLKKEPTEKELINILHVSTMDDAQKNISGIFNTLKQVSEVRQDFKLTIVSDGDINEAKKLLKLSGLNEKHIDFVGTKTATEIVEYYQNADFFLLFSNYENLPCVMVESLSCGLPVVSSAIAGVPEHIDKTNGILVDARNEDQLKDAILTMLANYKNYDRDAIRNYAVKHFDFDSVGKQFLSIYKEVINHDA